MTVHTFQFREIYPVVRVRQPKRSARTMVYSVATEGLEFSDYGRSEHFPAGWWIVPGFVVGLAFWIGAISLLT